MLETTTKGGEEISMYQCWFWRIQDTDQLEHLVGVTPVIKRYCVGRTCDSNVCNNHLDHCLMPCCSKDRLVDRIRKTIQGIRCVRIHHIQVPLLDRRRMQYRPVLG